MIARFAGGKLMPVFLIGPRVLLEMSQTAQVAHQVIFIEACTDLHAALLGHASLPPSCCSSGVFAHQGLEPRLDARDMRLFVDIRITSLDTH